MTAPLHVSVIIPTYNRRKYLIEAIESVGRQQTRLADLVEIIVVDDGSTDGTEDALAAIVNQYPLRYVRRQRSGANAARRHGIELASGDWIAFLDSDDRWLPDKLEVQLHHLLETGADLCYCGSYLIDEEGRRLGVRYPRVNDRDLKDAMRHSNAIGSFSRVIVRRAVFEVVGPPDPDLPACQDYDMWLRILGAGFRVVSVPWPLVEYRVHRGPERISNEAFRILEAYRRMLSKWDAYGIGDPGVGFLHRLAGLELSYGDFTTGKGLLFSLLRRSGPSPSLWAKALLSVGGPEVYRGVQSIWRKCRQTYRYRYMVM